MFAQAGLDANPLACTTLINLVGDDLSSLNSATLQLAAFKDVAGQRTSGALEKDALIPVSQTEVAELIGETSEVKAWEFSDALANKDADRALDILRRLTKTEGEGVQFLIVFLSAGKLRELLTARALIDRGQGSQEALLAQLQNHSTKGKGRAIQPWLAGRMLDQCRKFDCKELRDGLRQLAAVEHTMKTSPPQMGRLALVRFVLDVCA
jgi:DNA polymerase III delta subunit